MHKFGFTALCAALFMGSFGCSLNHNPTGDKGKSLEIQVSGADVATVKFQDKDNLTKAAELNGKTKIVDGVNKIDFPSPYIGTYIGSVAITNKAVNCLIPLGLDQDVVAYADFTVNPPVCTICGVPTGSATDVITAANFDSTSVTVTIVQDQTTNGGVVTLTPSHHDGGVDSAPTSFVGFLRLFLAPQVADAAIHLACTSKGLTRDYVSVSTGPLEVTDLELCTWGFTVSKTGYKNKSGSFTISLDVWSEVEVEMTPTSGSCGSGSPGDLVPEADAVLFCGSAFDLSSFRKYDATCSKVAVSGTSVTLTGTSAVLNAVPPATPTSIVPAHGNVSGETTVRWCEISSGKCDDFVLLVPPPGCT